VPTFEEYRAAPLEVRLERLRRTPAELDASVGAASDRQLVTRPDDRNWCATEILCHLRDVEELFQLRFHTIVALDEPRILVVGADPEHFVPWRIGGAIGHPLDPDRWAEERQYRRSDGRAALQALMRRRAEVLTLLDSLTPADWQRGGIHLKRGRQTLADWVASLAQHDDNHLEQLRRALAGQA